jgi:hypothetical protein
LLLSIQHPVLSQHNNTVEPQVVDLIIVHVFGEQIDVQARFQSGNEIDQVILTILTEDQKQIAREILSPTPLGEIFYIQNLTQHAIQAFSFLLIEFEIEMQDGTSFHLEPVSYFYDDNRFQWQSLQTEEFTISWYQPDPDLGQEILATAYQGLTRIKELVQVPQPDSISIYAYASAIDMQETLKFIGESSAWVAGHAEPDFGTIVVSLPPGPEQAFEIRRQIPHELVHILLYQRLGTAYDNLPRWLNEGLASSAELFPNPDYQLLLEKAHERQSLIPLEDLCQSFPIDAANFQLAYAQAFSFTWYLQESYGTETIENLIQAYAQGQTCDQGVQSALDRPLAEVETLWRQAVFSERPELEVDQGTISMMILIGFAFVVPIGLIIKGFGKRG